MLDTLRALDTAASDWKLLPPPPPGTVAAPPPTTAGAASSEPPDHVGRYRLLESIGVGGMGAVYRAEDPQLSRVVAVKFPRLDTPSQEHGRAVQRFLREARAAARVRHPHICPIYDVGEEGGWPYVVMALVEGPSLAQRLSHGRYDDLQAAAALAGQVAEALAAVHSCGIVHRDLKPANILLDADGRAMLTDFGLAYPSDDAEHLTAAGVVVGTPAYMAPEQASGESSRVGPAADLYSLGVVLYQMVAGRLPYEGPRMGVLARILSEAPRPPSHFRPALDRGLEAVILRAMARRPEDRFPNGLAFAEALRRWSEGEPAACRASTEAAPAAPGSTVVRVDLPDGTPVTVSLGAAAAPPKQVAVSVREGRAAKGKRRRLAFTVTITFALLIGLGVTAAVTTTSMWSRRPGSAFPPAEIQPPPEAISSAPPGNMGNEWQVLFNGKDLNGWMAYTDRSQPESAARKNWGVEGGILFTREAEQPISRGWLLTKLNYGDFELSLDCKLSARGASGVAIRVPLEGDPSYTGIEIPIIDDSAYQSPKSPLPASARTGAIFDVAPPLQQLALPPNQWRHVVVAAQGSQLVVTVNDVARAGRRPSRQVQRIASGRRYKTSGAAQSRRAYRPAVQHESGRVPERQSTGITSSQVVNVARRLRLLG